MAQWVDMEAKKSRTERMLVRDHPTDSRLMKFDFIS